MLDAARPQRGVRQQQIKRRRGDARREIVEVPGADDDHARDDQHVRQDRHDAGRHLADVLLCCSRSAAVSGGVSSDWAITVCVEIRGSRYKQPVAGAFGFERVGRSAVLLLRLISAAGSAGDRVGRRDRPGHDVGHQEKQQRAAEKRQPRGVEIRLQAAAGGPSRSPAAAAP